MSERSLATEWSDLRRAMGLHNCSPIQDREMKKAFYAGAAAMLSLTVQISDESDEEVATSKITALSQEIEVFIEMVGKQCP